MQIGNCSSVIIELFSTLLLVMLLRPRSVLPHDVHHHASCIRFVLLPATLSKQLSLSLFLNKAFSNHHHPLGPGNGIDPNHVDI